MKSVHEYKLMHEERHCRIADKLVHAGDKYGKSNYLCWYVFDKRSHRDRLPIIRDYKWIYRNTRKKTRNESLAHMLERWGVKNDTL